MKKKILSDLYLKILWFLSLFQQKIGLNYFNMLLNHF